MTYGYALSACPSIPFIKTSLARYDKFIEIST